MQLAACSTQHDASPGKLCMKLQKLNIYLCEANGNLYRSTDWEWVGESRQSGGVVPNSSTLVFGVFRLPIPGLHFGNFLQIYACLFAVMILARFRAHPFYYIWRNQKSLLLIKTYFTARSFVRPTAIKWKCKCE